MALKTTNFPPQTTRRPRMSLSRTQIDRGPPLDQGRRHPEVDHDDRFEGTKEGPESVLPWTIDKRQSILAALALGAEGVQVGNRFIACRECVAHPNYKQAIVGGSEIDTRLFDLGAFRLRAVRTSFTDRIDEDPSLLQKGFSAEGMRGSWLQGDLDAGVLPAGENVGLIRDIPSVSDIIDEMIRGAE